MGQLTIRADDELIDQVKAAAERDGRSSNRWVTHCLSVATDPQWAGDETDQLRARLAMAGVLASTSPPTSRPSEGAVQAAGLRAAEGPSSAEAIHDDRR